MIIKLVKSSNKSIVFSLIILLLILLRGRAFISEIPLTDYSTYSPLFNWAYQFLQQDNWHVNTIVILSAFLVGYQAIQINKIVIKHDVLYKPSYLVSLVYIICMSTDLGSLSLTPLVVANIFVIPLLDKIMLFYRTEQPIRTAFDIGILMFLATIVFVPYSLIIILLITSLKLLRSFDWRVWSACFIGMALPVLYLISFYFLFDSINLPDVSFSFSDRSFEFSFLLEDGSTLSFMIVTILILIIGLWRLKKNFYKNVIQTRMYQQIFLVLLLISIVIYLLTANNVIVYSGVIALPASIFIAYLFLQEKNFWVNEPLFLLLLLPIILNYF